MPFKNFRHSSGSYIYGLDQNLKTVTKRSGHKTPSTFLRFYAQALDTESELLVEKIEADFYAPSEEVPLDGLSTILGMANDDPVLRKQILAALGAY